MDLKNEQWTIELQNCIRNYLSQVGETPSLRMFSLRQAFLTRWHCFLHPFNPANLGVMNPATHHCSTLLQIWVKQIIFDVSGEIIYYYQLNSPFYLRPQKRGRWFGTRSLGGTKSHHFDGSFHFANEANHGDTKTPRIFNFSVALAIGAEKLMT